MQLRKCVLQPKGAPMHGSNPLGVFNEPKMAQASRLCLIKTTCFFVTSLIATGTRRLAHIINASFLRTSCFFIH